MLWALNSTFLALIPKSDGANKLSQFRPISLCNVIYKIISKVIVDRLKTWLIVLISEEQSGFVVGRQILDGVVIATESIHSMDGSTNKAMFIKLDMAKAYDRVRWSFLWKIFGAFGFGDDWIRWVMSCVTSISFLVLINGEPLELFGASRGLLQGDPLSVYLVMLFVEGLGHLLRRNMERGLIQGWRWGGNIPP